MTLPIHSSPAVLQGCLSPGTGLRRWTCFEPGFLLQVYFSVLSHRIVPLNGSEKRWQFQKLCWFKLRMKDLQYCTVWVRNLSWSLWSVFILGIVYYIYFVHQKNYLFWTKRKAVWKFHSPDFSLISHKPNWFNYQLNSIPTDSTSNQLKKKDLVLCCYRICTAAFNIVNSERQPTTIFTLMKLNFCSLCFDQER